MVVVGGLALLSEVAVRLQMHVSDIVPAIECLLRCCAYLNAVFEAVQLCPMSVSVFSGTHISLICILCPISCIPAGVTDLPAAVCDLATGLADCSRAMSALEHFPTAGRNMAVKARDPDSGVNIPFKLMTSRMLAAERGSWVVRGRLLTDERGGGWVSRRRCGGQAGACLGVGGEVVPDVLVCGRFEFAGMPRRARLWT